MDLATQAHCANKALWLWRQRKGQNVLFEEEDGNMSIFRFIKVKASKVILVIRFVGTKIIEQIYILKAQWEPKECIADRLLASREVTSGGLTNLALLSELKPSERFEQTLKMLNDIALMIHEEPEVLDAIKNPLQCSSAERRGNENYRRRVRNYDRMVYA